jgi:hypothetical protein
MICETKIIIGTEKKKSPVPNFNPGKLPLSYAL